MFDLTARASEVNAKLASIRSTLLSDSAVVLRGSDWFAWATAGASNVVLLTTETGIAELLITADSAWVLTDPIEAQRLMDEELPSNFKIRIDPWATPAARQKFIQQMTDGMTISSDRPDHEEQPLPAALLQHKRTLLASEVTRYRKVGGLASSAMREVMSAARPSWTEYQLAGAGAEALWSRGLHPALTLAASERRLSIYRHPTASTAKLGRMAMLVFCARGYGLYADLTRFVSFGSVPEDWAKLQQQLTKIEAKTLDACHPGAGLNEIYSTLNQAYRDHGFDQAIQEHHQGGTTGYRAREIIATPETFEKLSEGTPIAFNPSLWGGAKMEDTFIVSAQGLQNITYDADWPHDIVHGRQRPRVLEQ